MPSESATIDEVLGRVVRLERQNRRMKSAGVGVLLLGALGFLTGQSGAQRGDPALRRTVEAQRYLVQSEDGEIHARFGLEEVRTTLPFGEVPDLQAERQLPRRKAVLSLGQSGQGQLLLGETTLSFIDQTKTGRIDIGVTPAGLARVDLDDSAGNDLATFRVLGDETAALVFFARDRGVRTVLMANPTASMLQLADEHGQPRVELGTHRDDRTWLALLDTMGRRRVSLSLDPDGSPRLELFDEDEEVIWSAP